MTPLGLGLGLGFNRGGVSNESAPDIERNGLVFNLDASDISKLFHIEDGGTYSTPTVGQTVNKIVTDGSIGTQNLETYTLTNAFLLSLVNGKYGLTGNGSAAATYTKNKADPASTTAPGVIFTNEGNFVVVTFSRPKGTGVYFSSVRSGANYYPTISSLDAKFQVGSASNGYEFPLSGVANIPIGVRAINNVSNAAIGYNDIAEMIMTGTYTAANTHIIGNTAAVRTKYTLYGIQIYNGLTDSVADKAKALDIVKKARAYYGVA